MVGTAGTVNETSAVPVALGLPTLVAVTVTLCAAVIAVGAVYTPAAVMLPVDGMMDHVTPAIELPETVAANVCVPPDPSDTADGSTFTVTWGVGVEFELPPHPLSIAQSVARKLQPAITRFMGDNHL